MTYYLAGYYLVRPKLISFGPDKGKVVQTCSSCINDNLLDTWAYSWTIPGKKIEKEIKATFHITDDEIAAIRAWVDKKFEEKKIGWADVFLDQETALTYKQLFFAHVPNVQLMAIYLSEEDAIALISEFEPQQSNIGEMGIIHILNKRISEHEATNEETLGYDFIGVEVGGSFHTFYCNNVTEELLSKLGLTLNSLGLFDRVDNWKQTHEYLNDEANGLEPVPWVIAKTKLVR
ncbi:MAG: hypothetical protein EOO10_19960 [Chitinophagaceae bacterium]|nr:MAG: hypothetical protein EOO10_19960 [Chitinophagaceae bacterium]